MHGDPILRWKEKADIINWLITEMEWKWGESSDDTISHAFSAEKFLQYPESILFCGS